MDRTRRNEGTKRILIVDDAAGIRTVIEEALGRLGDQAQGVPMGFGSPGEPSLGKGV